MTDFSSLSRRERQIMEILFGQGPSTALQIQERLPNAPGDMAIRRLLKILEEKGHVVHTKSGRENVYRPKQAKGRVAKKAMKNLLETFFEGNIDNALAAYLSRPDTKITDEQFNRMMELIEQARKNQP